MGEVLGGCEGSVGLHIQNYILVNICIMTDHMIGIFEVS